MILGPVADERQAQEDVVVVVGERRDDVRFVAELDERDADRGTALSSAGG